MDKCKVHQNFCSLNQFNIYKHNYDQAKRLRDDYYKYIYKKRMKAVFMDKPLNGHSFEELCDEYKQFVETNR